LFVCLSHILRTGRALSPNGKCSTNRFETSLAKVMNVR
jgi:hypothetical protein